MSFFRRMFGGKDASAAPSQARTQTISHFTEFVGAHTGCEAFIEPATRVTQTTMVIVAASGEWTRRKVPDESTARSVAKKLNVPVFDVNLSGYPSRMREWNEKHRGEHAD